MDSNIDSQNKNHRRLSIRNLKFVDHSLLFLKKETQIKFLSYVSETNIMLRDERNSGFQFLSLIDTYKHKCLVQIVYEFFSSSKVDYKIKTWEKYKNVINHKRNYVDIVRYEKGKCEDSGEAQNLKSYKNPTEKQETKEARTKISPSIIYANSIRITIIRTWIKLFNMWKNVQ